MDNLRKQVILEKLAKIGTKQTLKEFGRGFLGRMVGPAGQINPETGVKMTRREWINFAETAPKYWKKTMVFRNVT